MEIGSRKVMKPTLLTNYRERIIPELMKSRGYSNVHEVPRIQKIVINSALNATLEKAQIEETVKEISLIAGQKPIITRARHSVSNFKVRQGMPLGVKVTLRGTRMYEFLYRLIAVSLPGIRDFRGISHKLDGNGNYNLGITDHTIFPEISMESNKRHIGMDITLVTSASTDDEGRELLTLFGMPFRKREVAKTTTEANSETAADAAAEAAPAI